LLAVAVVEAVGAALAALLALAELLGVAALALVLAELLALVAGGGGADALALALGVPAGTLLSRQASFGGLIHLRCRDGTSPDRTSSLCSLKTLASPQSYCVKLSVIRPRFWLTRRGANWFEHCAQRMV